MGRHEQASHEHAGQQISYSSLSEDHAEGIVTVHDVRLHVLGEGDCYDLSTRRPIVPKEQPKRKQEQEPTKSIAPV